MSKKLEAEVAPLIWDRDVCGPDALKIADAVQNAGQIAAWWERVKLYAHAMDTLNRAVLLKFDREEGDWYLSSVEAEDPQE